MLHTIIFIPLFALITPFLLWPIELYLPYPYIIEEVAKGALVYMLISLPKKNDQFLLGACIGILFALSETVLYLPNLLFGGSLALLFLRLLLTTLLHTTTTLLMLSFTFLHPRLFVIGFILACFLHYLYNLLLPSLF